MPRGALTPCVATRSLSEPFALPPWSSGTVNVEHVKPRASGQRAAPVSVGASVPPPGFEAATAQVAATTETSTGKGLRRTSS